MKSLIGHLHLLKKLGKLIQIDSASIHTTGERERERERERAYLLFESEIEIASVSASERGDVR